ncbi:MAG: metN1 [Clostridia bacterium]|jgi:D-methionine transport system ATP-binding protein|nr:metN1 [Clostridia bacterium]
MIEVINLSKSFTDKNSTVEALKNINLKVEKGDIYGIIGLSGAGKSTLIRCINRLEEPTSGSVVIDGQDIMKLKDEHMLKVRRRIGMIFQSFNLLSRRDCSKNIAFPLEVSGCHKNDIDKRVDELLALVGLEDKKHSYPSQLSGGQKQRVAIARALAAKADILLCDEATSALDPSTTKSILALLKEINTRLGITVILITHQMEVIKEICNKVAVISDGEIVEQGATFELFSKPSHPVTKRFIGDKSLEGTWVYHAKDKSSRLYKLTFLQESAHQPVISQLIKTTGVEVNIIAGHISNVQGNSYGNLVIELSGADEILEKALQYLIEKNLYVEELVEDERVV